MPDYARTDAKKYAAGSTLYVSAAGAVLNTYPHTSQVMGKTQSMTSNKPKGSPLVLLFNQETYALYPELHPVTFNRVAVVADPLVQKYWMSGLNKWLVYNEPTGLATLAWFRTRQIAPPLEPTQRMKDLALTLALSRVGTGPFMGAVDLGEVNETIRFLKHPFRRLGDIFTRFTKKAERNFAKVRNQRKSSRKPIVTSRGSRYRPYYRTKVEKPEWQSELLADTWLEFGYAATPLVLSISSLAEEATRSATTMCQKVHSARGSWVDRNATAYPKNPDVLYDGASVSMHRATNVDEWSENKASYVIRYIYYPWMVDAINLSRFGLSPAQLPSTTWELIPLSFVGDWFVNFGTWLKAMEPKPQCKIIDVVYSQKYELEIRVVDTRGTFSYYNNIPGTGATATFMRSYMKRSLVTDILQAPVPRFLGKELSLKQTLDAVALLTRPMSRFFDRFGQHLTNTFK